MRSTKMRIASNKFCDVVKFFHEELNELYSKGEIDVFVDLCFETYLGCRRAERMLMAANAMAESSLLKFSFAVKELKKEIPIQYILERADFYRSEFIVNKNVLIPRPETEELVDLIIKDCRAEKKPFSILDIGTGSGCIAVSLKKNLPEAEVFAMDISQDALGVAERNAIRNNAPVCFINADILSPLPAEISKRFFDVIVSNPPYVCVSESVLMEKNVLENEPHIALFVENNDALLFYRAIADMALKHLSPEGKIYFEINPLMDFEMKTLMEQKAFKNVVLLKDINDKNRILRCTR